MKLEISEEIISGWRREFDLEWTRVLVEWDMATDIMPQVKHSAWMIFLSAKTSSHERILEIQGESDNHNKSFLNMFEQNEEKAERILELEKNVSELKDKFAGYHNFKKEQELLAQNEIAKEKLTKRDELLKEALPYIENADDCELSIGEKTINTEKWIKNYKQMEQEK